MLLSNGFQILAFIVGSELLTRRWPRLVDLAEETSSVLLKSNFERSKMPVLMPCSLTSPNTMRHCMMVLSCFPELTKLVCDVRNST